MPQQFVVPQFIEVEDRIFGPITTRQFLILLGGGILIFLAYRFADFALFVTITAIVGAVSLIFAFVKINGQTFHYFLLNIIQTTRKPSLRVWRKEFTNKELNLLRKENAAEEVEAIIQKKTVRREHIRDLSLVVNTGGYYRAEE